MRKLLAPALLLAALLCPAFAHAVDFTLTCTPPTKWDNGDAIAAGTAITFKLYGALTGDTKILLDTKPACSFPRTNVAVGSREYQITASIAGAESDPSPTYTKVVGPLPPPDPAPLITSGPYSYALTGTASAPSMSAIGLVVGGLPCGPEKMIGTVKFCQITRAQTDLIGWPVDKTLASGVWARAQ